MQLTITENSRTKVESAWKIYFENFILKAYKSYQNKKILTSNWHQILSFYHPSEASKKFKTEINIATLIPKMLDQEWKRSVNHEKCPGKH